MAAVCALLSVCVALAYLHLARASQDAELTEEERMEAVLVGKPRPAVKEGEVSALSTAVSSQRFDRHAVIIVQAPFVHATRFPYPKRERWWVILIEVSRKGAPAIIGIQKARSPFR